MTIFDRAFEHADDTAAVTAARRIARKVLDNPRADQAAKSAARKVLQSDDATVSRAIPRLDTTTLPVRTNASGREGSRPRTGESFIRGRFTAAAVEDAPSVGLSDLAESATIYTIGDEPDPDRLLDRPGELRRAAVEQIPDVANTAPPRDNAGSDSLAARRSRIGVIDDQEITVRSLESLLSGADDLEFAGGAKTVEDLVASTSDVTLAVLDLGLPDGSSTLENVRKLRDHGIPTLIFSTAENPFLVRAAAAAGVLGVVEKSSPNSVVLEAIRSAARGEPVTTRAWAAALDSDDGFVVELSQRQRTVLELYASGESTHGVAQLLDMSVDTVNMYLDRVRVKYANLGRPARTKSEMYDRAVEDGFLSPRNSDSNT